MSSKEDHDFSKVISKTLDNLGFQKEHISLRSNTSEEVIKLVHSILSEFVHDFTINVIPAGSSGEGVQLSDSDIDFLIVWENAVCLDHGSVTEQFTVLETDYTNTPPGYTKLTAVHITKELSTLPLLCLMSRTYYSMKNYSYISSSKYRQELFCSWVRMFNTMQKTTTNGPAVTHTFTKGASSSEKESDNVFSIYFYGGGYLPRWANRARYCNWPSENTIKDISEMEGYVVPVGDKQSENQDLEWRICYTTAEKKLISNLNSIQLKLYVLLKLLAKHILKPVCKALTSYVVKNVVFWITETTPREVFSPDNLVHLVLKSLHFIKHCFENNHFPNYMIPERNLFRGAVCGTEKKVVINFLSECLREGRHVILKIPRLYQCMFFMVKNPESMTRYGKWRDEVERLEIVLLRQSMNIQNQTFLCNPEAVTEINNYDTTDTTTRLKIILLVVPESVSMVLTGMSLNDVMKLFNKRMKMVNVL